jgi:hypothetical protein
MNGKIGFKMYVTFVSCLADGLGECPLADNFDTGMSANQLFRIGPGTDVGRLCSSDGDIARLITCSKISKTHRRTDLSKREESSV